MNTLMQPKNGKRFCLVNDHQENTMVLIDTVNHYVVMSDSVREKDFNSEIIDKAYGDVLCLGFGIGFVLQPLIKKEEVKSITVIEKYQDVLDVCASQFTFPDKVRIIHADAVTWQPDMKFDVIWDDCDWLVDQGEIVVGGPYEASVRLKEYLNPDGLYLKWRDDGRYRESG